MHPKDHADSTPTLAAPGVEELTGALAAPFDAREVRFKPAVVSGNRALALAYVDARVIQDRLDDVLGVTGWQDEYECLPDGSVVCRLRLRLGDEWITKMDVGGPSEQPDEGDRRKAAFSDALEARRCQVRRRPLPVSLAIAVGRLRSAQAAVCPGADLAAVRFAASEEVVSNRYRGDERRREAGPDQGRPGHAGQRRRVAAPRFRLRRPSRSAGRLPAGRASQVHRAGRRQGRLRVGPGDLERLSDCSCRRGGPRLRVAAAPAKGGMQGSRVTPLGRLFVFVRA